MAEPPAREHNTNVTSLTRARVIDYFAPDAVHRRPPRTLAVPAISLQRVSKAWGAARAVDDVSFDAAVGTLVVLLGAVGLRKIHDAPSHRRARDALVGPHHDRRRGRDGAPARAPPHLDGLPVLRALPPPRRRREHPLRS